MKKAILTEDEAKGFVRSRFPEQLPEFFKPFLQDEKCPNVGLLRRVERFDSSRGVPNIIANYFLVKDEKGTVKCWKAPYFWGRGMSYEIKGMNMENESSIVLDTTIGKRYITVKEIIENHADHDTRAEEFSQLRR